MNLKQAWCNLAEKVDKKISLYQPDIDITDKKLYLLQIRYIELFTSVYPEVLHHPDYNFIFGKIRWGKINFYAGDTRTSFEILLDMQNDLNVNNFGTKLLTDTINVLNSPYVSRDDIYRNFNSSINILEVKYSNLR